MFDVKQLVCESEVVHLRMNAYNRYIGLPSNFSRIICLKFKQFTLFQPGWRCRTPAHRSSVPAFYSKGMGSLRAGGSESGTAPGVIV